MKNEIQIRTYKVDYPKLIEMALDRKDWGKENVIYTYGRTTISIILEEFDFIRNVAWFRIYCKFEKNGEKDNDDYLARFCLNNFSLEDFKIHLLSCVKSLINNIIDRDIKTEAEEYNKALYVDIDKVKDIENLFSDFEQIKLIKDTSLKRMCLEKFYLKTQDDLNTNYRKQVSEYIKTHICNIEGLKEIRKIVIDEKSAMLSVGEQ